MIHLFTGARSYQPIPPLGHPASVRVHSCSFDRSMVTYGAGHHDVAVVSWAASDGPRSYREWRSRTGPRFQSETESMIDSEITLRGATVSCLLYVARPEDD